METKEKRTIWQRIGLFFFDRKLLTTVLALLLVSYGVLSYTVLMRKEGFPSVDVPVGLVRVVALGSDAVTNDERFARPIIASANEVGGVKDITAKMSDQGGAVSIVYEDGTDVTAKLDELKRQITPVVGSGAELTYIAVNASKLTQEGDDVLVSVHAERPVEDLDAAAQTIGQILQDKGTLIERVNYYPSIEQVDGTDQSAQVRFDRYFESGFDGVIPSVAVGVVGKNNVDQLALSHEVEQLLGSEEVRATGMEATIAVDFAEGIKEQVSGLQTNLIEGLVVVIIVSFILISWRGSLVTALSMTMTVAITVGILHAIGYTLNTITLFSLVLCLALIVDDTTIMVEAIDAALKRSRSFRHIVVDSLKKVLTASAAGTFTTILAFAPMLFIGGVLGKFIRAIPITIIISLLVSLAVSLTFIPLFMRSTFGRRFSVKEHMRRTPSYYLERWAGQALARALRWSVGTQTRSIATKLHVLAAGVGVLLLAGTLFMKLEFNIFPAPKDGIEMTLTASVRDRANAQITDTEQLAQNMLNDVVDQLVDDLEKTTLLSDQQAGRDGFRARLYLSDMDKRDKTSVELAGELQTFLESRYPETSLDVQSAGVGPPEGVFSVLVRSESSDEGGRRLASDIARHLQEARLIRPDKTEARISEVSVAPPVVVERDGTSSFIAVSAAFDDSDFSRLVKLAETSVKDAFPANRLAEEYGLQDNALAFDFGQEEENSDSFSSMGTAAIPLFVGMYLLIALLFKSFVQPILIFTALPFALLGVAFGLLVTDNPLSFFSMLGVFALVGISVNNTILLTDYANQARKTGLMPAEAMATALQARLRPLLTTSITSVLALLPLALNDPFWEGLAFTLVFGLLASTLLVILLFPYYYLIAEGARMRIRYVILRLRTRKS